MHIPQTQIYKNKTQIHNNHIEIHADMKAHGGNLSGETPR